MTTITAEPYTARQCQECAVWIKITITAPDPDYPSEWEEGGEDYAHYAEQHPDRVDESNTLSDGFPWGPWNTEPVEIEVEQTEQEAGQ